MKSLTAICFILFVAGVVVFLAQIWGHFLTPDIFFKMMITDGVVLFVVFVANFLIKENRQTDAINRGDKVD